MIILENWNIETVLGEICLSGRVAEDSTGRYKKFDHIVSKPLVFVYFESGLAFDRFAEYKLYGPMQQK